MDQDELTFYTVPNTEDPGMGGYFAYTSRDMRGWRGYGNTRLAAIFCLILLIAEQNGVDLSEQAGDIVMSSAVNNLDLEKALERRYGGRIDYLPDRKLSR